MKNIEIKKIYPHPDNPRCDVGDVSELAASIKANGIMQNLTVIVGGKGVPEGEDGYTVIIGHRRLEAAKQAGLTTVPCTVVEMAEKEQIATMLLENMQRSDLTVSEQAHGMQMMFDLGETEAAISEKTGLSVSTVSRRLKIAKLNSDKLKGAELRGGTLEDYLKVTEIKNEKTRNKLLDKIGTNNFEYELRNAKDEQVKKEQMPIIKKAMKKIGAKEKNGIYSWSSGYEQIFECNIGDFSERKLTNLPETDLFWNVQYGRFSIFKTKAQEKSDGPKLSKKEKAVRKANGELTRLSKQAFELRCEFVKNFNSVKLYEKELNDWAIDILFKQVTGDIYEAYENKTGEFLKIKPEQYSRYVNRKDFEKEKENAPGRVLLAVLLNRSGDWSEHTMFNRGYYEAMPTAKEDSNIHKIYKRLESIGYKTSDMEKQLLDGTHPAYTGGETK